MNNGEWYQVCAADDIDEEDVMGFEYNGKYYAIYRLLGDIFYASDGLCTHEQVKLADGFVFDGCIQCPRHNATFDVKTGKAETPPATEDLRSYRAEKRGDKVFVLLN